MAARALAGGGARRMMVAGPAPVLASCWKNQCYSGSAQPREAEEEDDERKGAAAVTSAQVEAALNRKNVEVLQGQERVAAVLPDVALGLGGAPESAAGGEDASWVPDQDTGVFVPADAADGGSAPSAAPGATTVTGGSVLDQAVFVREEDMEDVERPAMSNAAAAGDDAGDE